MLFLAIAAGVGCSSLTTPVLRHEIGEPLGFGHFRLRANFETARLFPLVPESIGALGLDQERGVFQGTMLGLQGAAGVHSRLDLQLGTFYSAGGGGWRLGAKYHLWGKSNFALAGMVGFGRYSARGSGTYATPTGAFEVNQTLSAFNADVSFPFSYRFGKSVVAYTGLNYYGSSVTGSADLNYVSGVSHDLGTNLGLKLIFGRFEGDVELAVIRLYDPFADSMRFTPYWGLSFGLLF